MQNRKFYRYRNIKLAEDPKILKDTALFIYFEY